MRAEPKDEDEAHDDAVQRDVDDRRDHPLRVRGKQVRLLARRVAAAHWLVEVRDTEEQVLDVTEATSEDDAERKMNNYRRFGAWERS